MSAFNTLVSKFSSGLSDAAIQSARSMESTLAQQPEPAKRIIDENISPLPALNIFCFNALAVAQLRGGQIDPARARWFVQKFGELVSQVRSIEVRPVAREFATSCRCLAVYAMSGHSISPLVGVSILRAALVKLRPTINHLTPVHVEFVKLCVYAHAHHRALSFVDENVFNVDMDSGVTIEDVLTYAYYAGMAYCGARQFVKARTMFLRCMSTPATSPSSIAVEAYKKFVLVSLIVDGKVSSAALTDSVPQALSSVLPRVAEAYHELASSSTKGAHRSVYGGASAAAAAAADDGSSGKKRRGDEAAGEHAAASSSSSSAAATASASGSHIDRVAMQHIDRLRADHNLGLLKQAVAAEQRINVKRQTKTYLTMSLSAIAQRAGLANAAAAEDLLLQMIEAGEIFAKISARDGMVVFQDVGEAYAGAEQLANINGMIDKVMQLGRNIRDLEHELKLDPVLIKKQLVAANAEASFASVSAATVMALDH